MNVHAAEPETEPSSVRVVLDVPSEFFELPTYARGAGSVGVPDARECPILSAEQAFEILGIDRSTGYRSIREGTFPLPVIRVGRLLRVPTIELRRLLALEPPGSSASVAVEDVG